MSVQLADVLAEHGLEREIVLVGHEGFALASITAGLARQYDQDVVRRPRKDDPAHAEVFGKKTSRAKRAFSRNAVWVVAPDDS